MTIVYEKKPNEIQCNGSTTKLMTALIAYEKIINLSATVTVLSEDLVSSNESRVNFQAGDVVTYLDLLYGLMLPSGNDAANCLARTLGGKSNFVNEMNVKANSFGMINTNFDDAPGISYLTRSTANDLSLLMYRYSLVQHLVDISATMTYTINVTGVNARAIQIESTVKLHISKFPDLICAKTGTAYFNEEYKQYDSGGCIVALWRLPNNQKRITVILGSGVSANDRYDDLRALMDYDIARSKL